MFTLSREGAGLPAEDQCVSSTVKQSNRVSLLRRTERVEVPDSFSFGRVE
jgi:hypothetical protein